jgi:hypothetical protein
MKAAKTRAEAEAAAANYADELLKLREQLTAARKVALEAEGQWLDKGGSRSAQVRREAMEEVERLTALESRAAARVRKAELAIIGFENDEKRRAYDAHAAELQKVPDAIAATAAELVAIDRQVDAAVWSLAAKLQGAQATYRDALRLAGDLSITRPSRDLGLEPSLEAICIVIRRTITEARIAEGREPIAELYLRSVSTAWQTRDQDPRDLSSIAKAAAVARAQEAELAQSAALTSAAIAGLNAGAVSPQPPKETNTNV